MESKKKKSNTQQNNKRNPTKTEVEMFQLRARAHDGRGNLIWSK